MALASVSKTTPAFLGISVSLLAILIGLVSGYRPRWDKVEVLVSLLALWLIARLLLQYAGVGESALLQPLRDFSDWAWVLTFAALGAGVSDPLRRVRHLWLLAMAGFALSIGGYFAVHGFTPLLEGERLGFHLKRPLGVGLYAGAFMLMLLFTVSQWWYINGWLRKPMRLFGSGMLILCLVVLIAAQNRSTWLAFALVCVAASIGFVRRTVRATQDPRTRLAAIILSGLVIFGTVFVIKGPIETRTVKERQALITLFEDGLAATSATPITVRLRLWDYVLSKFPEAPLLGNGFGGLEEVLERNLRQGALLQKDERQDHVHSSYLQLLYGQGLVGVALWATLAAFLLRDLVRTARRDDQIRKLLPAIWAVLAFTAIWAVTDYRLSHPDMRFFSILQLLSLRLLGQCTHHA